MIESGPPGQGADDLGPIISDTAKSVTTVAVAFVATLTYLAISMCSTDDQQLLENGNLNFPIQNSGISCRWFYLLAPFVIVFFHLYLFLQEYFLAEKLAAWGHACSAAALSSIYPSLSVACALGGKANRIVRFLGRAVFVMVYVFLPLGLLLILKMRFLRYHDLKITWVQGAVLIADLLLVLFFLGFTGIGQAQGRQGRGPKVRIVSIVLLLAMTAAVAVFNHRVEFHGDCANDLDGPAPRERIAWLLHRFARSYLDLNGKSLKGLDLTRRDLRCADFRRTTLESVDFKGDQLSGARFDWATLKQVNFSPRLLTAQQIEPVRDDEESADSIDLFARDITDLSRSNFDHATADDADFSFANLQWANLQHALFRGARFTRANLERADLSWATGPGSKFAFATLNGVNLLGADLQLSSFRGAHLLGGHMVDAALDGADFAGAELAGGDFRMASLRAVIKPYFHQVVLRGAKLGGIDVCAKRRAGEQDVPAPDLVDLRDVDWDARPAGEWMAVGAEIERIRDTGLRQAAAKRLLHAQMAAATCLVPAAPGRTPSGKVLDFATERVTERGGQVLPQYSTSGVRKFYGALVAALRNDESYPQAELWANIEPPPPVNRDFTNALACLLRHEAKADSSLDDRTRQAILDAAEDCD
jgi:uncharacterized protein YjbI with pentapeptide repeats